HMPRRRLGQHFLHDNSVARRIVNAADISVGDVVIEIGPGNGALTHHIVDAASFAGSSVVLVEIDPKYAVMMEDKFASNPDVRVVCADARDIDFEDLPELSKGNRYKVVANLPYYAGTPIVRSFLEREHKPESMTVMLQREVARDMCATPGKMSLLSIAVQIYAEPKKLFDVPPAAFRPPPKVHSTVIKLVPQS
ncbi:MAG: ribosomal RNA small subunit methyltransferase A, partial [Chloroflexi bacterium]|nr:ribosomal RNA small subunit methyltransferase A [Chloroflexota bacterium]